MSLETCRYMVKVFAAVALAAFLQAQVAPGHTLSQLEAEVAADGKALLTESQGAGRVHFESFTANSTAGSSTSVTDSKVRLKTYLDLIEEEIADLVIGINDASQYSADITTLTGINDKKLKIGQKVLLHYQGTTQQLHKDQPQLVQYLKDEDSEEEGLNCTHGIMLTWKKNYDKDSSNDEAIRVLMEEMDNDKLTYDQNVATTTEAASTTAAAVETLVSDTANSTSDTATTDSGNSASDTATTDSGNSISDTATTDSGSSVSDTATTGSGSSVSDTATTDSSSSAGAAASSAAAAASSAAAAASSAAAAASSASQAASSSR